MMEGHVAARLVTATSPALQMPVLLWLNISTAAEHCSPTPLGPIGGRKPHGAFRSGGQSTHQPHSIERYEERCPHVGKDREPKRCHVKK